MSMQNVPVAIWCRLILHLKYFRFPIRKTEQYFYSSIIHNIFIHKSETARYHN